MEKNDLEALKLLKEWCTWLVALETAVMAAIIILQKDVNLSGISFIIGLVSINLTADDVYNIARGLAGITIAALAVSIYHAGNMLLVLPAAAQRLPPPNGEDIYSVANPAGFRWRLYIYVNWIRGSSVVGLICFALLLIWVIICYKHVPPPASTNHA
jgi:hypothetical protein